MVKINETYADYKETKLQSKTISKHFTNIITVFFESSKLCVKCFFL